MHNSTFGFLYNKGYGVEQDYDMARLYYELVANQGNAEAQYNLGVLYDNGYGVEEDNENAHH